MSDSKKIVFVVLGGVLCLVVILLGLWAVRNAVWFATYTSELVIGAVVVILVGIFWKHLLSLLAAILAVALVWWGTELAGFWWLLVALICIGLAPFLAPISKNLAEIQKAFEEAQKEAKSEPTTLSEVMEPASAPVISMGENIEKLAALRQQGLISNAEFQAFSERFKLSIGEKASNIIKAVATLHEQYQKGAMTKGNFHASLWSLLDKLDRKT